MGLPLKYLMFLPGIRLLPPLAGITQSFNAIPFVKQQRLALVVQRLNPDTVEY